MSPKKIDVAVLLVFIVLVSLYTYFARDLFIGKAIFPALLSTLVTSIYLGLRAKKPWLKIIVSSLIFGALFGFIFEFFQEFNSGYHIVSTIFPKLFGVIPLDNLLGHTLMTFSTLVFYEHFVNKKTSHKISKKIALVLVPALLVAGLIVFAFYFKPEWLLLKYPYLTLGVAAIVPPIFLALTKRGFAKDMALMVLFFFVNYFIIEIFAVKLNWWVYPGNYIGWITITFPGITFPLEELFFWMMFYAASLVSYYKLFIDN